jgi:hypothetical protein
MHYDAWVACDEAGSQIATVGPRGRIEVRRLDNDSVVSLGEPGQFDRFQFDWTGRFLIAVGWYVRNPDLLRAGLFDIQNAQIVGECEHVGLPSLHPGRRILASAINHQGDSEICFHRLTDKLENFNFRVNDIFEITGITFSPRGRELAVIAQDDFFAYAVLDFPSCATRFSHVDDLSERDYAQFSLCRECVFSADSRSVFFPSPWGYIVQLDSDTGSEISRWQAHDGAVTSVSIRHDLHMLVSGGVDGMIKLWQFPATTTSDPTEAQSAAAQFEAAHEIISQREQLWQMCKTRKVCVERSEPSLPPAE